MQISFELDESDEEDWGHVVFCVEDWQFGSDNGFQDPKRRIYYSIFSACFQVVKLFTNVP